MEVLFFSATGSTSALLGVYKMSLVFSKTKTLKCFKKYFHLPII